MARIPETSFDRRDFLIGSAGLIGAGAVVTTAADAGNAAPARVQRYVPLGRTGMQISDISYGASRRQDPAAVRHAFDRGINYFDTADGYRAGGSERAIGAALHDVRDQVYITTKTKASASTDRHQLMQSLEASLRRLRTDYVDVFLNHAVNDVARLENEEWRAFTERAKAQGKIRFRGMSGHAGRLVDCLGYALDHELVDVILAAYNFGQDPGFIAGMTQRFDFVALQPDLPPLLERAHREGVGVVVMKTLMGARLNDVTPYLRPGQAFEHAAFRWTLSNPNVDALIVSMNNPSQIDNYLRASGSGAVTDADLRLLERYVGFNGARHCQHGCDICHASCPAQVAISEVLRTRMYDVDYRDAELARADYAALERDASPCLSCSGAPCAGTCPNGIPIAEFTRDGATRLA